MIEIIKIIVSFILFIIALFIPKNYDTLKIMLYFISYLLVGFEIIVRAFKNLWKKNILDENFLMMIATIGAILIKSYEEAVCVMLFYQIGELFQNLAVSKSRKSIINLMDLREDYANLKKNGKVVKTDLKKIKVGDLIVVRPGEKIPLDGIVLEGTSEIDTSKLTGESLLRVVDKDSYVLSGFINISGQITMEVKKTYDESTVSKILNLVENASEYKAPQEKFITKFSRYYTPCVIVLAIIVGIIVPFILNKDYTPYLYKALSFLVVSCPCALVVSIPLSFFSGIGKASMEKILIKGSSYLEKVAGIDTIVFDKTNTLTKGNFVIDKVKAYEISEDKMLELVSLVENASSHPIALALKQKNYNRLAGETNNDYLY